MLEILDQVDVLRREVTQRSQSDKAKLGQFMTPTPVARFMASLFSESELATCNLLDAGAGMGALTAAFLERWSKGIEGGFCFKNVVVKAYEIDPTLRIHFEATLNSYLADLPLRFELIGGDFIKHVAMKCRDHDRSFTHAILNPPYKKINSGSEHRHLLRKSGIETVNLYTAFVALALDQLVPGGEIVAILPRSFCNGPYYRPFRDFVLRRAAITRIHLFKSRNRAFKDDDVLQENIIILLTREGQQTEVTISTSTDERFDDYKQFQIGFDRIVNDGDTEHFIHIPTSLELNEIELMPDVKYSLSDIGLNVSTGPVVDFRLKEHLLDRPTIHSVPLIYPGHLTSRGIEWPQPLSKKANAIERNAATEKWLYPIGHYCVVRRFSSKEERRRVVATVFDPHPIGDAAMVGFENHLNIFHENKQGIPLALSAGLAVYLNSTAVDQQFRRFNGHTQVNATDLKNIKYPSRESLITLGIWAMGIGDLSQNLIDETFGAFQMNKKEKKLEEAELILTSLGFPQTHLNKRSSLCLLALLDRTPSKKWNMASAPLIGITPIMNWSSQHYDEHYAPNTRETFRRQSMHQFVDAGVALYNPDKPGRPVNSPKAVYQIAPAVLQLIKSFGAPSWHDNLAKYLEDHKGLAKQYAQDREQNRVPVTISKNTSMTLSPGAHSELIKSIIEDFATRFAPGSALIYAGDTGEKMGYFDASLLASLGVKIDPHGKLPDVVLHYPEKYPMRAPHSFG